MSYENAPSTKLLATHCACCARPLRDAVSVEAGVGPECRRKHGYGEAQGEPDWAAAGAALDQAPGVDPCTGELGWRPDGWELDAQKSSNVIVQRLALEQTGARAPHLVNALRALGFVRLADIITRRLVRIEIELVGDELLVKAPYNDTFTEEARRIRGRRFDYEAKVNRFPAAAKAPVWAALRKAYPGEAARGPKGIFTITG